MIMRLVKIDSFMVLLVPFGAKSPLIVLLQCPFDEQDKVRDTCTVYDHIQVSVQAYGPQFEWCGHDLG